MLFRSDAAASSSPSPRIISTPTSIAYSRKETRCTLSRTTSATRSEDGGEDGGEVSGVRSRCCVLPLCRVFLFFMSYKHVYVPLLCCVFQFLCRTRMCRVFLFTKTNPTVPYNPVVKVEHQRPTARRVVDRPVASTRRLNWTIASHQLDRHVAST